MLYLVQSLVSSFGTEGATLFKRPLRYRRIIAHNGLLWNSGFPNYHIIPYLIYRTRELAPAVRDHNDATCAVDTSSDSDFCCLLSCCYLSIRESITIQSTSNLDLSLDFLCRPHSCLHPEHILRVRLPRRRIHFPSYLPMRRSASQPTRSNLWGVSLCLP